MLEPRDGQSACMTRTQLALFAVVPVLFAACSTSPDVSTDPVAASRHLATDLGRKLDATGIAPRLAESQSVLTPWFAWDASTGRTVLETLAGDRIELSMDYWDGTLWSSVRGNPLSDAYCLQIASTPGVALAWWVKGAGDTNGELADETACNATPGM